METPNFVEGLYYNEPSEKAPDFIVANLSFKKAEFLNWLDKQADIDGYVKVCVKRSQKGGVYAALDTYVPKARY